MSVYVMISMQRSAAAARRAGQVPGSHRAVGLDSERSQTSETIHCLPFPFLAILPCHPAFPCLAILPSDNE